MRYRRALLLHEIGQDPSPALAALRGVADRLEHLAVVAWMPVSAFAWLSLERSERQNEEARRAADALRDAAERLLPAAHVRLVPELTPAALAAICEAERIDLAACSIGSRRGVQALYALRRRLPLPLLFATGQAVHEGPSRAIACFALGERGQASIASFLRDQADPAMHVTLLGPSSPAGDLGAFLEIAGIRASVERSHPRSGSLRGWVEGWRPAERPHLLVFAQLPALVLLSTGWPAPVLLLPPPQIPIRLEVRSLDLPDLVDLGGPIRMRVELAAPVGAPTPLEHGPIAVVAGGRIRATVEVERGEAELPAGIEATTVGICRLREGEPSDPLPAIEERVSVVRPGSRPLLLFDAELPDSLLASLAALEGPPAPDRLAVRLRPTASCRALRQRLEEAGLPPVVADARAILDEGDALDVPEQADALRLSRVAQRMRRAGFPVAAIVHGAPIQPRVAGFGAISAPALLGERQVEPSLPLPEPRPIPGNRLEMELDNSRARRWLLEAIEGARRSFHLQVYMAADDEVGRSVGAALARAAGRGVRVRLLVDSLHGRHGSFGARNPLLDRLGAVPGIELRLVRPITEFPSVVDLKHRDHRKIAVADGRIALLGGRNLSHEYYTGFDEVRIDRRSLWRQVPWLDAGARLEGPAVAEVEAAFREAWIEAGGDPFPIVAPPPAGETTVRVLVHRGLQDTVTLDAYRASIDEARSHLYVVNGFPLALELQHALVRAIRRGVRVVAVVGHLTPTWNGRPFDGPFSTTRAAATELVHSRFDPLVEAGGEVYLFAVRDVPGWAPELGLVHPHVHAKLLSADGARCIVGSANLDLTSAYWESELALLVEEPPLVRDLEARIEARLAHSVRLDPADPAWREQARRRAWMRHWPGNLSI